VVEALERDHTEFFKCLTVEVKEAITGRSMMLNLADGKREVPPEMKALEYKLGNRRIFV
jgi:hypothetical protein